MKLLLLIFICILVAVALIPKGEVKKETHIRNYHQIYEKGYEADRPPKDI